MAAPPNTPPPGAGEGAKDSGVEVCLFDESLDGFSRTVRAISELTTGEPELDCPQAEVERIASSVTFLREWRHFTYDPKGVSFTDDSEPASSRNGMHNITLPQFSSASVPQITQHEDQKDSMASFDFVLFAGGNVWALDWCPRLSDKPGSSINCEYLAVSAHPPGSSYHKLGMPLSGRGLIQVWCLLAPFEDEYSYKSLDACNKNSRRGRPRKIPGGNNTVSSPSNPPKPRGRPRKIPDENNPVSSSSNPPKPRGRPRKRPIDISEPVAKRPRGRPRKYPLPVAVVEDSSLNSRSQDIVPFDPLSAPTVALDDLPLATETESGKDTTCQPVDHTACTESDTYLSITAVDAALPIISSSTATCERGRKQNEELISSSNDPAVSVENALPSGESNIVSATSEVCSVSGPSCEGIVHNGILSDNFVTPNHIPRGKKGRGRPRKNPFSTSTRFSGVSGGNSPKTASIHYDLDKSDGKFISSNLGSVSSCGLDIEKCSIHLNFSSPDDASPTHGLHNEECKESITRRGIGGSGKKHVSTEHCISIDLNDSEPRTLTTPKSNGNVPLVESFVEGSHPREDGRQHKNLSALNETSSSPIPKGIDGMKAAELVPFEEPREDDKNLSSIENSYSSPIPKDIALPRIVLCLAHNGKVAWDIKWKPLIANQPEQESCLGFLAVLLGNGSLEVWEVPSPRMIQKIYSPSTAEGSDPRFVKLQPVFRCAKVTRGNKQCIPLAVDWSPSPPHDLILAGCHDGTVALWKFSTNLLAQDSKPLMCVTADSVPVRALSWAPYMSEKNINTFVTAGDDGLKFWDLRDPYRPLWELTTAPRTVLSLHWLKVARGIVISLEDGTLKFLSLPRIANDVPITGRPFVGTKTQGVSTYQLSEYLIWSIHASEITGLAAYCGADGTAVRFELTSRFWEKEPGRNRAPYFLCGSLSEEGENIKIGINSRKSPLSNVPLGAKKAPKSCQDVVQMQNVERDRLQNITDSGDLLALTASSQNPELRGDKEDGHMEEHGAGAMVLAGQTEQANDALWNIKTGESPKDFEVFPPKSVALHRVRWNTNKGSERWLCYGGAAGIIRCQRI